MKKSIVNSAVRRYVPRGRLSLENVDRVRGVEARVLGAHQLLVAVDRRHARAVVAAVLQNLQTCAKQQ